MKDRIQYAWTVAVLLILVGVALCGCPRSQPSQVRSDGDRKVAQRRLAIPDLGITLIPIEKGEFVMGSPKDEAGRTEDERQHRVKLTKPFWLGATEVTIEQFRAYLKDTDNIKGVYFQSFCPLRDDALYSLRANIFASSKNQPMVGVSFEAATGFCEWLTQRERAAGRLPAGQIYRLPTEAEWEFACRAGSPAAYSFGGDARLLHEHGNYCDRSCTENFTWKDAEYSDGYDRTAPVGQYHPNSFGLYDMHGNVYEWCADWYGAYPAGVATDPTGPAEGTRRVLRGGSWRFDAFECRSASRQAFKPSIATRSLGFRVARGTGWGHP